MHLAANDVQTKCLLNDGLGNFDHYQSNVTAGAISLWSSPEGGNYGSILIDYDNVYDHDFYLSPNVVAELIQQIWMTTLVLNETLPDVSIVSTYAMLC
jgi:hypothetical protein